MEKFSEQEIDKDHWQLQAVPPDSQSIRPSSSSDCIQALKDVVFITPGMPQLVSSTAEPCPTNALELQVAEALGGQKSQSTGWCDIDDMSGVFEPEGLFSADDDPFRSDWAFW
jgi:hypothetical protein